MNDHDLDLTPDERDALGRLPRERVPPAHLEERVVGALRAEGLLGGAAAAKGGRWNRAGWLMAAAAAGLALFAGGTVVGQRMATRDAAAVMAVALGDDPASRAARVQETGSAYVRAVAGLSADGGAAGDAAALEAATVALHAAALELARVTPDDPTIRLVLAVLEERLGSAAGDEVAEPRTTFWF